jgi:integrase
MRNVLSPASRKNVIISGTIALRWAYRERMISENITDGLLMFAGPSKKRGVLSLEEARKIFTLDWKEKRALVGNILAMTTGLRAGEILALRKSDIDPHKPVIYVRHSWSSLDGLKSPKNGDERKVPLLPEIRTALMDLLTENPYKDVPDPFIFYSVFPDKPMDDRYFSDGLKKACRTIGVDPVPRNIVFHSWRHFYAARMADIMTAEQVQRITGQKSRSVFEVYQDHITEENLEAMGRAGSEVFGKILPFAKEA